MWTPSGTPLGTTWQERESGESDAEYLIRAKRLAPALGVICGATLVFVNLVLPLRRSSKFGVYSIVPQSGAKKRPKRKDPEGLLPGHLLLASQKSGKGLCDFIHQVVPHASPNPWAKHAQQLQKASLAPSAPLGGCPFPSAFVSLLLARLQLS